MSAEIENLCIPLTAIRRGGDKPREISLVVFLADLRIGLSKINEGRVEVDLELISDGNKIKAQGSLFAEWTAECRRCLEPVEGELKLDVCENFVEEGKVFDDEETEVNEKADVYFFNDLDLDLEPLIRDAVLLALPLSPLCDLSCEGSEPEEFPVVEDRANLQNGKKGDPRWAVLDRLKE